MDFVVILFRKYDQFAMLFGKAKGVPGDAECIGGGGDGELLRS